MKKYLLLLISVILILTSMPACKSKKGCANFSDPKRSYKNSYNKKGLVKKKGVSKPSWDN